MRRPCSKWLAVAATAGIACGSGSSLPPYSLEASGGTYNDGSGAIV